MWEFTVFHVVICPFLGGAPTSICHFFRPSVRPSVHRAPYLRNCTSFNHNFWYTCKMMISPCVFFIFFFFEIFIFWAVMGVKGQKIAQNEKYNYIRHTPYLRNSKACDHDFCYTYVKWWYILVFFLFFWTFHFLDCQGGKRAKNSPKWKITITSVMRHISGTV